MWLKQKILVVPRPAETGKDTKQDWVTRMSVGAAAGRHRYTCEASIYGGVVVDKDEFFAAKLEPDFILYQKIRIQETTWNSGMKNTKMIRVRVAKVVENGDIVIEEEEVKSDDGVIEDNQLREVKVNRFQKGHPNPNQKQPKGPHRETQTPI